MRSPRSPAADGFTIEKSFRDAKSEHVEMGLSATRITSAARCDSLLLVNAVATAMWAMLGVAGESVGMGRMLKANTSKERTRSLLFQASNNCGALMNMRAERSQPLSRRFGELLLQHAIMTDMLGLV